MILGRNIYFANKSLTQNNKKYFFYNIQIRQHQLSSPFVLCGQLSVKLDHEIHGAIFGRHNAQHNKSRSWTAVNGSHGGTARRPVFNHQLTDGGTILALHGVQFVEGAQPLARARYWRRQVQTLQRLVARFANTQLQSFAMDLGKGQSEEEDEE